MKFRARTPFALLAAVGALSACSVAGGDTPDTSTRPDSIPAEHAAEAVPAGGELPHWTYEGEEGPEHWGELAEDWSTCSTGEEQSPIDVTEGTPFTAEPTSTTGPTEESTATTAATATTGDATADADGGSTSTTEAEWAGAPREQEIAFGYRPSTYRVVDTGHLVQVDFDDAGAVEIDGVPFTLVQMHFHTPSEHTLGGAAYPVEYHFVHLSEAGEIAVFGVIVQAGAENEHLAPIMADLPSDGATIAGVGTLDPAELMPANRTMVRYNGSLTTPPCSEHVRWHLFLTPIQLSDAQITAITAAYPGSARPTQELGDREVVVEIDRVTGVEGAEEPAATDDGADRGADGGADDGADDQPEGGSGH